MNAKPSILDAVKIQAVQGLLEHVHGAATPYMARESYSNYQTEEETEGALEHAYGPNYGRLIALKNKLDPTNFFHLNTNVRPTA